MSKDELRERINKIQENSYDDEVAHSLEDDLYRDFIESLAAGTITSPATMAKMLLETKKMDFARWCA